MGLEIRGIAPLLEVFDMPAPIRFYAGVPGFKVASRSAPDGEFSWALLERGGAQLMVNTAYEEDERPPSPDPARVAVHRDTALYFGCPDVDSAYLTCGRTDSM